MDRPPVLPQPGLGGLKFGLLLRGKGRTEPASPMAAKSSPCHPGSLSISRETGTPPALTWLQQHTWLSPCSPMTIPWMERWAVPVLRASTRTCRAGSRVVPLPMTRPRGRLSRSARYRATRSTGLVITSRMPEKPLPPRPGRIWSITFTDSASSSSRSSLQMGPLAQTTANPAPARSR